jgi:hypothetical protein
MTIDTTKTTGVETPFPAPGTHAVFFIDGKIYDLAALMRERDTLRSDLATVTGERDALRGREVVLPREHYDDDHGCEPSADSYWMNARLVREALAAAGVGVKK